MTPDLLGLLRRLKEKCPLFFDFSDHELKTLLNLSKIKKFNAPGQTVFSRGDEGDSLFLILSGEVEVFIASKVRGNSSISTLSSGDIFGEMSLITREKRSANCKSSDTPLLLLEISKNVLKKNMMLEAKIYKFFALTLADRLKAKNNEVTILKGKLSRLGAIDS